MKHARPDYDRIQDPAGLIPEDEPVFLLRAQDPLAALIVATWARHYCELYGSRPDYDPRMYRAALDQVDRMRAWPTKQSMPDMPKTEGPTE